MVDFFNTQEKQIFTGNVFFIICCIFYLAWWLLAFKPAGAVGGIKTGWLLIPASLTGLLGVILAIRGILGTTTGNLLFPGGFIIWGGIAAYLILLTITSLVLKRPATTELILIVGWGMLALAEINVLFGMGLFSHGLAAGLIITSCAAIAISLVCYVLYYRLDNNAGYIDGIIPLVLAALVMAGILCFMLLKME